MLSEIVGMLSDKVGVVRESGCCQRKWMLSEKVDVVRESGCCQR